MAENKITESEKKYRMIFENAISAIVLIDKNGLFTDVNPAFTKILGYSRSEIIHQAVGTFATPNHKNKIISALKKLLNHELTIYSDQIEITHKNGHLVWIQLIANVHLNTNNNVELILVEFFDITKQQQNKKLLEKSEEKYRQLFHFMPLGVSVANADGQLIENNKHAEKLLELTPREHNARTIDAAEWQIVRKDGTPMPPEEFASVRAVKENKLIEHVEMGIVKGNDKTTWLNVSAVPVVNDNGVIISYTDITEKIKHEQALFAYTKELQQINQTKDKLFSILSHDLKNPFSTLIGFSKLLLKNLDKYDKEKIRSQLTIINEVSEQTYQLLEDILLWSKAQSNRISFEPITINAGELLNEIISTMMHQAQKKNIGIQVHTIHNLYIQADLNMLQIIIRNLVSNAIKFTPRNGSINIYAISDHKKCIVSLEDNGIGIPTNVQNQLFLLSSNYSSHGTENETGSGFGLILCKEFVEKHGEKIWLESTPNVGSKFSFSMPIKENAI